MITQTQNPMYSYMIFHKEVVPYVVERNYIQYTFTS